MLLRTWFCTQRFLLNVKKALEGVCLNASISGNRYLLIEPVVPKDKIHVKHFIVLYGLNISVCMKSLHGYILHSTVLLGIFVAT